MKKTILIAILALIGTVTFAQTTTSPKLKKEKPLQPKAAVTADSVKVSAAELKVLIGNFYQLVDDSSDISRKASKPILQALHDFYAKTFPEPTQPVKPIETKK